MTITIPVWLITGSAVSLVVLGIITYIFYKNYIEPWGDL